MKSDFKIKFSPRAFLKSGFIFLNIRNLENMNNLRKLFLVRENRVTVLTRWFYSGILVVLAEEELVALQLNATDWPMLPLPYLVSLHASAVTCSTYVSDVPQSTWDNIVAAGRAQVAGVYSSAVRKLFLRFIDTNKNFVT